MSLKSGRLRVSDVVSLVLNPSLLTGVFFCILAARVEPAGLRRFGLAALAFAFASLLPVGILLALKARGTLSDVEMSVRTERDRVYRLCAAGYAVGAGVLFLAGASWPLWGLMAWHVPNTFVLALANRVLKVSIHAMVLMYLWTAALIFLGRSAALLGPVVLVAAWARWDAGNHSPRELVLGAAIGGILGPAEISVLRSVFGS